MNQILNILQRIATLLALIMLAACGGTPVEPAAGEASPPDSPAKAVAPQPGAAISAEIATGEKASSGTLAFTVSADGGSLENLTISLKDANCSDVISMGSVTDFQSNPGIVITDGTFEDTLSAMGGMVENYRFNPGDMLPTPVDDPYSVGKISGRFTTPTTASGTITIYLGALMGGGIVCELGTFDWAAK